MKFTAQITAFLFALALAIPSIAQDLAAEEQPDETVAAEVVEYPADLSDEDLSDDGDQPAAGGAVDSGSLVEDAASDEAAPTERAVPEPRASEMTAYDGSS